MKSYSYSAFKDFDTCARQFYHVRMARTVKRTYDSAGEGKAFHKVIADAIKHNENSLPSRFTQYNWALERLKKIQAQMEKEVVEGVTDIVSEMGIGLTSSWEPRPFFHKENWYCGAIDLVMMRGRLAYLSDWKFGRSNYADLDQLYQQAMMLFLARPQIDTIRADLNFVKEKIQVPAVPLTLTRSMLPGMQDDVIRLADRIYNTSKIGDPDAFQPTPSGLCKNYCPVPRSICPHSGKEDDVNQHQN